MNGMHIFSCLFIAVSIAHVTFIVLKKGKLRRISKVCIMPLLLGVYIPGAENFLLLPAAALIFGWAGDILLLKMSQKKTYFMFGLVSFLLGHLCYTAALIGSIGSASGINIPVLLISVPVAGLLGVGFVRIVRPDREMFIPVIIYAAVIEIMSLWGLQTLLLRRDLSGLLIFAGCLFFMISDTMLGYFTFRRLKLWGAVLIMVTYIMAQAGIIYGFLGF